MSFNVKSEIMSAIAKTDDPNLKMILLLMLGVLEEIGGKIDQVWNDEKALREAVLNGHEPVHHAHHEWVAKQIKLEEEAEQDTRKVKVGVMQKVMEYAVIGAIGAFVTWLGVRGG